MAKLYFNPKENEIMEVLRDLQWHCVYNEVKQKDDRARLTAIGRKLATRGWAIKSEPCTLHKHDSRILMRRIVKSGVQSSSEKAGPQTPSTQDLIKASIEWFDKIPEEAA